MLRRHLVDLLLGRGLARQCFPGQVLAALPEGGPGLVIQVVDRVLQLLLLQFKLLLRPSDVDERAGGPG